MPPAVVLRSLVKEFVRGARAVDEVSLEIAPGEMVVLVGPSGCGKTTTLRLVAGLETATTGRIEIGGRDATRLDPKDRDVAMVFQNYALYPHMTVRQNLGFALKMRRTPKAEIAARVDEAAAMLGIADLLERRPAALSGGQQQRVALGRALVRRPSVFLFDEPLSNLDAARRLTMRTEIRLRQRESGIAAIYVTHDQEEAMTIGDRVVVMAQGRVQQAGAPMDVWSRPANAFVASFIGAPAMNMVPGRATRVDGAWWWEDDRGASRLPIAPGRADAARLSEHAPVVLGVRPQALRPAPADAAAGLAAEIRAVELLGDQVDLVGAVPGGAPVVARVPWGRGLPGVGPARLAAEPDQLHFFAPGPFGANLAAEG